MTSSVTPFSKLLSTATRGAERAVTLLARGAWPIVEAYREGESSEERATPSWAPAPLRRRGERSKPPLGWPRTTDSLCPRCVKEARDAVVNGTMNMETFLHAHPGEIKAQIIERDGQILMVKDCATHGRFEDVISMDPAFLKRIEELFPGRDFASPKTKLRDHGSSTIKYGRGSVLTVDLTNRCNMMCDPCFMDANQVGYVHELGWAETKQILDDSLRIKPRRQMSVQFSGGEPTIHPDFLKAVKYARDVGYFCVQCASNGIRFAQDADFAKQAKEAGLRLCYLQFDGVTNEANGHRKIGNLFDVKLKAIENLAAAGIDVVLVVTVVNGVNNDQVGPVVQFAIDNADKVTVVSFQPVSFTGRDEDISDEDRVRQRYTLSHLAHDVKGQLGITEPLRDWYPLSAMNSISDVVDQLQSSQADFGALNCGCHPNCGIGTILLVNKRTKQTVPLSDFLDIQQVLEDFQAIADDDLSRNLTLTKMGLSLLRNFRADKAPEGYGLTELIRQALSQMGASGDRVGASEGDAHLFEWRFLFVAGMWFQDLFNYDFRRTEMCIIPYGTQMGEISFCAYNTGVGFRQIVEKMHMTASVAEWNKRYGRHPVYAKNQDLPLPADLGTVVSRERRHLPLVG
ncbi:MAG TPA: radical SAM protein [Polyangiaceae bacterium]|nr:radical SAM protein [Polyangiaceae bacterium]